MRKLCTTIGMAVICSAAAMAQSSMDQAQMDKDKMMKDGMSMVTGCVAMAADGKHYMLNNAMMSAMPMKGMSAPAAPPAMSGDKAMMSYLLDGGDLKPHVGHKVEVSGTIKKMDKMSGSPKMDQDKMTMANKAMMADTLKVKSVKMLAASCQ